eukprot:s518_g13.t1
MTSSEEPILATQATSIGIRGAVSAQDVLAYVRFLKQKDVLTRMVSDSFEIIESTYTGVDQDELRSLVQHFRKKGDALQADMLDNVFLVGEGSSTFITSVPENNVFVNVILLYARRQDGKYDLLIAKGEQKKELSMNKVAVAATGATGLGIGSGALAFIGGSSLPSAVLTGGVAFLVVCGSAACKTCNDCNEPIENAQTFQKAMKANVERPGLVEVGVGAGVNFPYFKQAGVKEVVAVEPNLNFLQKAQAAADRADIQLHVMEKMPFADSSVDVVVGTLLLLAQHGGWLGEHVRAADGEWLRSVQDLLDPLQQAFAAGCHLSREPLPLIQESFEKVGVSSMMSSQALCVLVRWADLCAALATLGLEVTLWPFKGKKYPTASSYEPHHVVYTDYNGVHAGKGSGALPPPDKTWLLDTFGTDGTVVQNDFFGRISPLTEYPLHRFLTLVPGYSSRNTFLGVAAVTGSSDRNQLPPRRWQCVLWSKVHPWLAESNGFPAYHWKLLREYTKYCKVIATVDSKDTYKTAELIRTCCPEVEIREVQSPKDFQELLLGSAVYVGVGEPLIAPSCFEALSLGTHVVQPRFPEPRQLKNKPITQNWTSQHPFLEQVPEPYAFTVDPLDFEALATTFRTLRHAFDSIYTEERPVSFADKALREFYMAGEYPGREEFSISGFLKRVAGTVTKTRTLEAADWDWERGDHPQQLPPRAFKKWVDTRNQLSFSCKCDVISKCQSYVTLIHDRAVKCWSSLP